jgi:TP901 family phage tail tape measure protein
MVHSLFLLYRKESVNMQGIELIFSPQSIAKLKGDYDAVLKSLESRKVKVDFADINKSINELTAKVRVLQGIKLNDNFLPLNIKDQVATIQQAVTAYEKMGRVSIKEKMFDKGNLSSFVIELQRAGGIIDKIKYSLDGSKNSTGMFNVGKNIKEVDNSLKVAEQMVKQHQKINGDEIKKSTSELEKQLKVVSQLETKYQSLKFQPNTKQGNVNDLKTSINNNLALLGGGQNLSTEQITKTIAEVNKLGSAYDKVYQKDQKEIANRSQFYSAFIAKQKELNALKLQEVKGKTTENEKAGLQDRINNLTKELNGMKNAQNNYYKKTVSSDTDFKTMQERFTYDLKSAQLHKDDTVYLARQSEIYKQLVGLQSDEYNLKTKILTANQSNKALSERDLALTREKQSALGKIIVAEALQNNQLNTTVLERKLTLTNSLTQAQNTLNQKLQEENNKRQQYLNSLGKSVAIPQGTNLNVKNTSYQDMQNLARAIGGVNAEIKKIDVQPLQKGEDMVRKVTYRVKEGKDKWHEYQLALTQSATTGVQSLRQLDNGTRDVISRQVTLAGRIRNVGMQIASFAGITSVFYGFLRSLRQGITLIVDLDKAMTNIQMITGKSKSEVVQLKNSYSDLATELHTTTKEMMSGAENFLRAGKTVEETRNLLKASTIGSAISGQDNARTSEQLIAIANGYKLNTNNATELMGVIDKLSAVDNSSATSFAELSTALQYTASSAQNVGVKLPELISYIGTISSVSRRSAETIGQSMKTIFSRYESVSAKKDLDEEGEAINDVEASLRNVGIEIRKDATHFKDFNLVIDELSRKWSNLNDLQKSQTLGALAGTRQRENLLILLDNMSEVERQQKAMANSFGQAESKFNDVYGKSTQANISELKHQVELFWTSALNSNTINGFISVGKILLGVLDTWTNKNVLLGIGFLSLLKIFLMLKTQALALNGGLVAYITTMSTAGVASTALGAKTAILSGIMGGLKGALNAVVLGFKFLFMTPLGWIVLAMTAVVGLTMAWRNHSKTIEENKKKTEELVKTTQDTIKTNSDMIKYLQDEGKEYDALKNKTNLSNEEKKKLYEIQTKLGEQFPSLIQGYDAEGNMIINKNKNIKELTESLKENIKAQNNALIAGGKDALKGAQSTVKEKYDKIEINKGKLNVIENGYSKETSKSLTGEQKDRNISNYTKEITRLTAEQSKLKAENKDSTKITEELATVTDKLKRIEMERADILSENGKLQKDVNSEMDKMKPHIGAIISNYDGLTEAQKKFVENTVKITPEDLMKFDKGDFSGLRIAIEEQIKLLSSSPEIVYLDDLIKIEKPNTRQIEDYFKLISSLATRLGKTPLELTKLFPLQIDGKVIIKSLDEYYRKIQDAMKSEKDSKKLGDLQVQADQISNLKISLQVEGANQIDDASNKVKSLADVTLEVSKAMSDAEGNISSINTVLEKHAETNEWDTKALLKLAESYPQLLDLMNDDKLLAQELTKIKGNSINVVKAVAEQELLIVGARLKGLTNGYIADATNFKTSIEAKNAYLKSFADNLEAVQSRFQTLAKDSGMTDEQAHIIGLKSKNMARGSSNTTGVIKDIETYYGLKNMIAGIDTSLNSVGTKDNDGKKNSSSKDKETKSSTSEALKNNIFDMLLNKQNKSLEDQNSLIDTTKSNIESLLSIGSENSYSKALESQNTLYDEQLNKIDILKKNIVDLNGTEGIKKAENFLKSNWSSLSKKNISAMSNDDLMKFGESLYPERTFNGENSDKESKKYNDGKQLYTEWVANLEKLRNAKETSNKSLIEAEALLTPMLKDKWQIQFDAWENIWAKRADVANDLENELSLLETNDPTNYKEKIRLTNELVKAEELQRQGKLDANVSLKLQLSTLNEESQEWNFINNKVEEFNNNIDDSNNKIATLNKSTEDIAKTQLTEMLNSQQKVDEELNNQKHKRETDNLTSDKKIADASLKIRLQAEQDYYDAQKKIRDKAFEDKLQTETTNLSRQVYKVSESDYNSYKSTKTSSLNKEMTDLIGVNGSSSEIEALRIQIENLAQQQYSDLKDYSDAYKSIQQVKIDAIDAEIEALNKKNDLEEETNTRLENQNNLIEKQTALTEAQNEKNIKQLVKQSDGSMKFEFVVDSKAVKSAQDAYNDQLESNNKWETDLATTHKIELLNKEKQYEQNLIDAKASLYTTLEAKLKIAQQLEQEANTLNEQALQKSRDIALQLQQDAYDLAWEKKASALTATQELETNAITQHYSDMTILTDTSLENLKNQYGENWDKILGVIKGKLDTAKQYYIDLQKLALTSQGGQVVTPNWSGSSTGNVSIGNQTWTVEQVNNPAYQDAINQAVISGKPIKITPAETGGYLNTDGKGMDGKGGSLLMVHPNELILDKFDSKLLLNIQDMQKLVMSNIPKFKISDMSNINKNNSPIVNNYSFGDLSLPNMTNGDGLTKFINELNAQKNFKSRL